MIKKIIRTALPALVLLYLVLLIPVSETVDLGEAEKRQFIWGRDSLWSALENDFAAAKTADCGQLKDTINKAFSEAHSFLDKIEKSELSPLDERFSKLENHLFRLTPLAAVCMESVTDYIKLVSRLRFIVKNQSQTWDMNSEPARHTIYKLLYGSRAALEEIMLQADPDSIPSLIRGYDEPSQTPKADILGVPIHSGDILLSRGGAPTSALIARGNDYNGNFSHAAFVHVDEKTGRISIIEAHIEIGAAIASFDEYLADKKLRIMVLRLRSDLPQLQADPMLPHKAASAALKRVKREHIPYDFEMDFKDNSKLFCSEVISAPYRKLGVTLWLGISTISSEGMKRWLAGFGVRNFETQDPSDLEYDPQLRVAAEWRDPETLFKDHVDNAVIETMLERANEGRELDYHWYMLPMGRIAKLYSAILNMFGKAGPVPEGMSAPAALRNEKMSADHKRIKELVLAKAAEFKKNNNYAAPYWRLLDFSRDAIKELEY
jgi:hypothetical protein